MFVFAQTNRTEPFCSELPKLFAFPKIPKSHSKLSILDSGAFGLSQKWKEIDAQHMRLLAAHYRKYCGDGIYGIAPDKFLDPKQTMKNFEYWMRKHKVRVAPVIQCTHKKQVNIYEVMKQISFYKPHGPEFVCFSNPGLQFRESAQQIKEAIEVLRKELPEAWVHVLGAGWNFEDVKDWLTLSGADSIDSIAYHTSASVGRKFRINSREEVLSSDSFEENLRHNIKVIRHAGNYPKQHA